MIREERRKKRRRKHILIGFLTTLLILALAALIVIKVFTVKNVEVEGNKLYSDEQIKEWVLNDDYSWNTLYVYFKYRFFDTQEVPFIDTMEVSVKSPHTLHGPSETAGTARWLRKARSLQDCECGSLRRSFLHLLSQSIQIKSGFIKVLRLISLERGSPDILNRLPRQPALHGVLITHSHAFQRVDALDRPGCVMGWVVYHILNLPGSVAIWTRKDFYAVATCNSIYAYDISYRSCPTAYFTLHSAPPMISSRV